MTPLIFSKGLADAGCWGSKFYGRVTTEEAQVRLGCEHKTRRLKVIYGLDPVFESGSSCFMKMRSPIAYESREETVLAERNLQITKQVTDVLSSLNVQINLTFNKDKFDHLSLTI